MGPSLGSRGFLRGLYTPPPPPPPIRAHIKGLYGFRVLLGGGMLCLGVWHLGSSGLIVCR